MSSTDQERASAIGTPQLPQVTRLNRNVLIVAGMGVGVVILAISHVTRANGRSVESHAAPPVEAGAMASFLREPLSASRYEVPVPPAAYPELAVSENTAPVDTRMLTRDPYAAAAYDLNPVPIAEPRSIPRDGTLQRALRAGLRENAERSGMQVTGIVSEADQSVSDRYASIDYTMSATPVGVPPISAAQSLASLKSATAPANRYREFLATAAETQAPAYIASSVQEPISPYQIMAGTLLPAMLITGINSDLPGDILAQVTRNVYDSQQRFLLIPRGTKLIGRYDNQIALGQSRMLIAWTRLILPDGRSLSLPGLPTKDLRGATGLRDKVDNHYPRLYGQAALLSIVGAGVQLSQAQQSSVLAPVSAGQVAAGALGQELSAVSMETIRRNMDVRPTLQARPGTPFYIFLERDLALEGVYADAR